MEIYPNIHMIKGLASQQYLLKDSNELILIDAGLRMDANKINEEIEKYVSPTFNLKQILITHADGDHYGGVNSILKFHPTTIVRSSELESQAIREWDFIQTNCRNWMSGGDLQIGVWTIPVRSNPMRGRSCPGDGITHSGRLASTGYQRTHPRAHLIFPCET